MNRLETPFLLTCLTPLPGAPERSETATAFLPPSDQEGCP